MQLRQDEKVIEKGADEHRQIDHRDEYLSVKKQNSSQIEKRRRRTQRMERNTENELVRRTVLQIDTNDRTNETRPKPMKTKRI